MAIFGNNAGEENKKVILTFRWKYVGLPFTILLLIILLAGIFYPQLSNEVAYRFNLNGSPENWASRQIVLLLTILPQVVLFMTAIAITWGTLKAGRSIGQIASALKPERLLMLMGNLIVLPQIIFGFVMLDVFVYNVASNHIMPIWLFALIIMIAGGIFLTIFFFKAFKRTRNIN
ncbi:MAG: DUF1648 domain-containing protein [Dehalococcoidia bacterium]|nr:MAG: DUF1648 domain-containing protein [Dehalococcoidia bacterium]